MANGKGRRIVLIDGSGNTRWLYDGRGRVTQEQKVISGAGGGTFVTQWSYDAADRAVWQKYPGGSSGQIGEQVNFSYNGQGLLRRVQSNGSTYYVGETLYNALGQATDRYLGSTTGVIRQKYTCSQAENFRLTALQSGISPNFNNLQNISYTYDDQDNVLTVVDAAAFGGSQTQTFTYDALNRLLTAQATGGSYGAYAQRSYAYNEAGNITSFEGSLLGYNDTAHKHAVTHVAGAQKYWYDANGNANRRIYSSQDVTLAYDTENRLTGLSGAVAASYVYDGDGKRVKETISGVTRVFVGDYYEVDNGVVKKYYYAGAARVALSSGGTVYYLLSDHLGSTATTLNSSGARVTELRYFPYGGARYNPGGQMTTYRFTGQRWDSGTALYFYGARWLDPAIGRFLQPDTIVPEPGNPQALNRYSYVLNNPIKHRDPSGHCVEMGLTPIPCVQVMDFAARVWQQVQALVVQYGPQVTQGVQQFGNQLPALVDQATQAGQASQSASTNAGNTADPGGLDPNDPWFRNLVDARTRFDSVDKKTVPDIVKAYGGKVGPSEGIPETFAGRRVTTLGRFAQTRPAGEAGARILDVPNWSTRLNSDWIQEAIRNGDVFRLVTEVVDDTTSLLNQKHGISVFARELDALLRAGYIRVGDYLVPQPGL